LVIWKKKKIKKKIKKKKRKKVKRKKIKFNQKEKLNLIKEIK